MLPKIGDYFRFQHYQCEHLNSGKSGVESIFQATSKDDDTEVESSLPVNNYRLLTINSLLTQVSNLLNQSKPLNITTLINIIMILKDNYNLIESMSIYEIGALTDLLEQSIKLCNKSIKDITISALPQSEYTSILYYLDKTLEFLSQYNSYNEILDPSLCHENPNNDETTKQITTIRNKIQPTKKIKDFIASEIMYSSSIDKTKDAIELVIDGVFDLNNPEITYILDRIEPIFEDLEYSQKQITDFFSIHRAELKAFLTTQQIFSKKASIGILKFQRLYREHNQYMKNIGFKMQEFCLANGKVIIPTESGLFLEPGDIIVLAPAILKWTYHSLIAVVGGDRLLKRDFLRSNISIEIKLPSDDEIVNISQWNSIFEKSEILMSKTLSAQCFNEACVTFGTLLDSVIYFDKVFELGNSDLYQSVKSKRVVGKCFYDRIDSENYVSFILDDSFPLIGRWEWLNHQAKKGCLYVLDRTKFNPDCLEKSFIESATNPMWQLHSNFHPNFNLYLGILYNCHHLTMETLLRAKSK